MGIKAYFFLLLLLGIATIGVAQSISVSDSFNRASIVPNKADTSHHSIMHNPRKALLYSAAIPGLGQAYNQKYWKIPIVAAAFGTAAYFFAINNNGFIACRNAITRRQDSNPLNDNDQVIVTDYVLKKYDISFQTTADLFTIKQSFRKNRDISAMALMGVYVLNIVDAYVDAHLFHYDMSDNLSCSPLINNKGVGVAFNFR